MHYFYSLKIRFFYYPSQVSEMDVKGTWTVVIHKLHYENIKYSQQNKMDNVVTANPSPLNHNCFMIFFFQLNNNKMPIE